MGRGITEFLQALFIFLPAWTYPFVVAALLAVFLPVYFNVIRIKQVRSRVKRSVRAPIEQKAAHLRVAFYLARGRPRRLVALADEAIRFKLEPVWKRALAELEATGKMSADLQQLREKVSPERKIPVHPLEEVARVQQMLEAGAVERARERLEEALEVFPDDPELLSLVTEVDRARDPEALSPSRE